MYNLLIDTHSDKATLVLYKNDEVFKIKENISHQGHSNNIMPMIEDLLTKEKIDLKLLKEIFVVNGPGSFTGTRIGVTIAKTFAYSLNIPIKTISSLMIKVLSSDLSGTKLVLESDRNGFFIGLFDNNNRLLNDYFYLSKNDYQNYISQNNYEDNIVDQVEINYQNIYNYLQNISGENPHGVKPLYIKKIEVLND